MTAIRLRFAVTFLVLAASVAEAQAQQRPALSVGQPGALGLLWSVSNEVALRSDFSFSWSSFESPGRSESSSWTAIGGLSALFPIVRIDSLRGYFVPRISYRHMSSNSCECASVRIPESSSACGIDSAESQSVTSFEASS